jgi:hypothetical protein
MRTSFALAFAGMALTGVLCLAWLTAPTAAHAQFARPSPAPNSPAGFFDLRVTPDTATGIPPFESVAVVTADGRILNIDPSLGGTGVGEMRREDGHTFALTFIGFMPGGPPWGRFTVNATVDVSADGFAGPFRTTVRAPDGTVVFGFAGQVVAQRQEVEGF